MNKEDIYEDYKGKYIWERYDTVKKYKQLDGTIKNHKNTARKKKYIELNKDWNKENKRKNKIKELINETNNAEILDKIYEYAQLLIKNDKDNK
jgi:hypothetical protein